MTDPKNGQEPSMEDILASIRRIIDEDDRKAAPVQSLQPAEEEDEDVLDLTDAVDEPAPAAPAWPAPEDDASEDGEPDGDAPEADDPEGEGPEGPVEEDIGAEIWASDDGAGSVGAALDEPGEAIESSEQEASFGAAPAVSAEETVSQESTMAASNKDRLVSDAAMSSAAAALGNLARASERDPLEGVPQGRPVEELVMELLRPMLREWLDENLPTVVERIVEREVRYLSRRLGGDDGA